MRRLAVQDAKIEAMLEIADDGIGERLKAFEKEQVTLARGLQHCTMLGAFRWALRVSKVSCGRTSLSLFLTESRPGGRPEERSLTS